mmetsp:Transcript_99694/g.266366  ORF Transcript_99694/g.266366 Transcript_99694/m.266366 type:complete len:281 (-) Transcript_99694:577-1419(-)
MTPITTPPQKPTEGSLCPRAANIMPAVTYTGMPGTTGIRNIPRPTTTKIPITTPKDCAASSPLSHERKMKVAFATPIDITKYRVAHLQTHGSTCPQAQPLSTCTHCCAGLVTSPEWPRVRPVSRRTAWTTAERARNINRGTNMGMIMAPCKPTLRLSDRTFLANLLPSPRIAAISSVSIHHIPATVKIAKVNPRMVSLRAMEAPAMEAATHNVNTSNAKTMSTMCTADLARCCTEDGSSPSDRCINLNRQNRAKHPTEIAAAIGLAQFRYNVKFPFVHLL